MSDLTTPWKDAHISYEQWREQTMQWMIEERNRGRNIVQLIPDLENRWPGMLPDFYRYYIRRCLRDLDHIDKYLCSNKPGRPKSFNRNGILAFQRVLEMRPEDLQYADKYSGWTVALIKDAMRRYDIRVDKKTIRRFAKRFGYIWTGRTWTKPVNLNTAESWFPPKEPVAYQVWCLHEYERDVIKLESCKDSFQSMVR